MSNTRTSFLPGKFELWCLSAASVAILVLGNVRFFLTYYGLSGSSDLINQQVTRDLRTGLETIDSLSITATAVTFISWVIVGMIVISLVNTFAHTSQTLRFEQDVSSDKFIHPRNFNPRRYWQHIVFHTVLSFAMLAFLTISVVMILAVVIPVSYSYTQRFLLSMHFSDVPNLLLGLGAIFGGTVLVYTLIKAILLQHRTA